MHLASRLIGLHIAVLGFVWMIWSSSGGNLGMYIDIPSLVVVLVLLLGCSLFCFTPGEIGDAVAAVIAGPGEVSETRLRRRVAVAAQAYQLAWGAGIVVNLTGLIAMLADLGDPSAIGAGMAVSLISTLYGAFLAEFIFAPCRRTLLNHLDHRSYPDNENTKTPAPVSDGTGLWRGTTVVLLILCFFFVLTVSFADIRQESQFDEVQRQIRNAFNEQPAAEPGSTD